MTDNTMNDAVTMMPGGGLSLGRIDQYELLRELGGGGFGSVYLAKDTVAGIEVAVKGLPPIIKNNAEELERIRENFALVSRLHHPYIAAALHLQLAREVVYSSEDVRQKLRVLPGDTLMVMEYAPGVTLSKWRKQFPDGMVPLELAIQIAWQIAQALDYAHEHHIIHRDIKPANIMVETRPDGEVVARLLDFGLAAEIRSSMGRVSREIHDTSGTRPYMAPEQWTGRKQGPATDQYALAVLLYEMLTGEVPFVSVFDTGDPMVMMNAVCSQEVEFPEDCPRKAALCRALAKDPSQRFASCMDFLEAAAKSDSTKTSKRTRIIDASRRRIVKVAGLIASSGTCVATAIKGHFRRTWKFWTAGMSFAALAYGGWLWWDNYVHVFKEWTWKGASTNEEAEALAFFRRKDWKSGFEVAKGLETSHPEVLYYLGRCYDGCYGDIEGLRRDPQTAFDLLKRSADCRFVPAMVDLCFHYAEGDGCDKDITESDRLCRAALNNGHPRAYLALAWSYHHGAWTGKDDKKALHNLELAAKMGVGRARALAGEMYCDGVGTETNIGRGIKYLRQAAKAGDSLGQFTLGLSYDLGKWGLPHNASNAECYYLDAIKNGSTDACHNIGLLYLIEPNFKNKQGKIIEYWRLGADQGSSVCASDLASAYGGVLNEHFGLKIVVDKKEQLKWTRRAFELNPSERNKQKIEEVKASMLELGYSLHDVMTAEELAEEDKKELARLNEEAESLREAERLRKEKEETEAAAKAERERLVRQEAEKARAESERMAAEERARKLVAVELENGRNKAKAVFDRLTPNVKWSDVITELNEIENSCKVSNEVVRLYITQAKYMRNTHEYILNNSKGARFPLLDNGIVRDYDAKRHILNVSAKMGTGIVVRGYEGGEALTDRAIFDTLYAKAILKNDTFKRLKPRKYAELMIGAALIVKYFPCGLCSREMRIKSILQSATKRCPECKSDIDLIFTEDFNSSTISDASVNQNERYARRTIDEFSFDISAHFQIGPSLSRRLLSITTTDKSWNKAKDCKSRGDYLGVLSALMGKTLKEYPDVSETDAAFNMLRNKKLHILLEFKRSCDYVKCCRIKSVMSGPFKEVEAVEESSNDRIDDVQMIVMAKIGDGQSFMVTSSCFYDINRLRYGDYSSERRVLEKKLEHGLISRQEFEKENERMNSELTKAMINKAKTN